MRTTVTLDADVYEAANHLAKISGERLGKIISDLARCGLQGSHPEKKGKRRFATFAVPANAPLISAARVQRAIDEDGLS